MANRTAAELRAAATATGTFTSYQGDGASVPWEMMAVPFNLYLWAYKQYLDSLWPEAFRLHDWLYTPYGTLINATQEESDLALFEEIAVGSPADAVIVYNAVRLGGGLYFGRSQTGYSTRNMALAPAFSFGDPSMAIKVVMQFQVTTNDQAGNNAGSIGYTRRGHIGGWTEHVWYNGDTLSDLRTLLYSTNFYGPGLCLARARLLPKSALVYGVKLYKGGAGRGQTEGRSFPGNSSYDTDIPQMAALCRGGSTGFAVSRVFEVRCIPDDMVTSGEFSPTTSYASNFAAYFNQLGGFSFLANDPTNVANPIFELFQFSDGTAPYTNYAIVTLNGPNSFALNDIVTLNQVLDANGVRRSFTGSVIAPGPGANQFKLGGWTFGPATGGTATLKSKGIFNLDPNGFSVSRITTRKVGRPFEKYVGRRSSRR